MVQIILIITTKAVKMNDLIVIKYLYANHLYIRKNQMEAIALDLRTHKKLSGKKKKKSKRKITRNVRERTLFKAKIASFKHKMKMKILPLYS